MTTQTYNNMNNKQQHLNKIVDIVVECCSFEINGKISMSRSDLLGKSRSENFVMSRCILAHMIINSGYTVTTAALLLSRTPQAIRHLLEMGHILLKTSKAFRQANAECASKCKELGIDKCLCADS